MTTPLNPTISASYQQGRIAITNVRVFDGNGVGEPSTVVIDGGLIGKDAAGAEVIDGGGGVLLPGLIDAHIHLQSEHELQLMAEYGITSALDMATWPHSKLQALRGRRGVTDIRSPGLPATSPGSLHSALLPLPPEDLVTDPKDAAQFVANRIKEGVDYIKVIADVPGPSQATLDAIIAAAHEQNMLVVAHASAFVPFAMAQDAKADIITHAPTDKVLDEEACSRMMAENRISVPTLAMMEAVTKPPTWGAIFNLLTRPRVLLAIIRSRRQNPHGGGRSYEVARDSVTALHRAGVPILAGTDAHDEPGSPFQVKHGDSLHHELELLVEAGLSTVDALRAATSLPATHFNLKDRGVIEVGKRADLVLISQDPIQDIRATRSIQRVWCGGIEVTRSS